MQILTFFKTLSRNLFHKPATRLYPLEKREAFARTRGHIDNDINSCIFCGICQKKCPTGAIWVKKDDKSWTIDRLRCIQCNSCVEVCPKKCLEMRSAYTAPTRRIEYDTFRHA